MDPKVPHDDEIDPQVREFIGYLAARSAEFRLPDSAPASERRRVAAMVRHPLTVGGPAPGNSRDYAVPNGSYDLKVRIMNAAPGERRPALVYLHGGGWIMFSIETHDRIMRELAVPAGIAVVGIDYSLSPNVRYPTQLDEIGDVLQWLQAEGTLLGIDTGRLFVGGDSAGANLAITTCLRLRDQNQLNGMRGMVLCYGVYDGNFETASYHRYADPAYLLSRDEMLQFWQSYIRTAEDLDDPLVSPLRADLHGLPPAMMIIAERDVLHDENVAMARKLLAAGVDVQSKVYRGTTHSFLEAVSMADVSRQALQDAASWLQARAHREDDERTALRQSPPIV